MTKVRPSREVLVRMYVDERMSTNEIGKELKVSQTKAYEWIKEAGIEVRKSTIERGREMEEKRPSREELQRMHWDEHMSLSSIGEKFSVSQTKAYGWIKEAGIEVRKSTKEKSKEMEEKRPSNEVLVRMYVDQNRSLIEIGKELNVSRTKAYEWIKEAGIEVRSHANAKSFLDYVRKDEATKNLVGLAVATANDGLSGEFEQMIVDLSNGKFRSKDQVHELIEGSKEEVYALIRDGVTNLGTYIGEFTLADRRIVPVLLNNVSPLIPLEKWTSSLEDRLYGFMRAEYGPRFNENPAEVIGELEGKIAGTKDGYRNLLEKLKGHYVESLKLMDVLS